MKYTKRQIESRMIELLGKAGLSYFDKKKVRREKDDGSDTITLYLDFCLPFDSIKNIINLCKLKDLGCAFDRGKFEVYYLRNIRNRENEKLLFTD
ncbi:hypothetical protein HYS50_01065 [Candidatus Woesearchaeota archaeon]|nr:hypothetical protein [Candidatus Woesearchaeota archaeon]